MELRLHRRQMELRWGTNPALSRGYFPTEMCFTPRLIPILKSLGIEWTIISGNHLSRACTDFPLVYGSGGENCEPPNRADILNPAQGTYFRQQISRGCAPANAVPFAYTPHMAQYVDPVTGAIQKITVVPAAQEFSWVDGYQCFSANQMDAVKAGSNPSRPALFLLAHDGDNAFGGGYSYYMQCTPDFVNNAPGQGYKPSTIEQYLQDHPVPANDVVHVENGGWVNADGDFGSPTYINWLYPLLNSSGQPDPVNGWHEKAREYAMFLAAENRVRTAEQVSGLAVNLDQVLNPNGSATAVERAWHYYLGALDSGNVYYGTPGDMEVRSTVGINQSFSRADAVLAGSFTDLTNPSVFTPQRWPYNPGSVNFGVSTGYQQKVIGPDFTVWTFAYDVSGIASAKLCWRKDLDGTNTLATTDNETYAGGPEVGAWTIQAMNGRTYPKGNVYNKPELNYYVQPTYVADHFSATITSQTSCLIDYYVEVTDTKGNVTKTPIQHVYVGNGSGSGGGGGGGGAPRAVIVPAPPTAGQQARIEYDKAGGPLASAGTIRLHWGINNWGTVYSPDVTMTLNPGTGRYETTVTVASNATQVDAVFNDGGSTWDNNSGGDWHFPVVGTVPPPWTIDGTAETTSIVRSTNAAGKRLWVHRVGNVLYVGTEGAAGSSDRFIYLTRSLATAQAANWAKAGTIVKWDAYLANESTNNFNGWFDGANGQTLGAFTQTASGGAAGVLEGSIDLAQLYAPMAGSVGTRAPVPATIYIAAGSFGTNDGGALDPASQVPSSTNSDGNLDAAEFYAFTLGSAVEDWTMY